MKKLFIILFLCITTVSFGQEFSVNSFFLAETDLTANTPGTIVEDQNGNPCALIKVETTLNGYTFNVGVLGIKETKRVGGEIWVYVPFGVKKITIGHPELGTIRDYPFPCKIDKGRTYILKLNAKTGGRTYDTSKKQRMVLNVYPASATVEINNTPIELKNGTYSRDFSFGIYDITVSAPRYHSLRKQIEIDDLNNAEQVNIHLKQKFGWLQIPGDGDEKLWIDDQQKRFVPGSRIDLNSGHYRIRMTKPMHEPFETTLEIKDSVVNKIIPNFIVRYREMEFNVAENAEIWINGRHFGNGYWKGRLEYGQYSIECKKSRHVSSILDLKIESNTIEQVTLKAPVPTFREIAFSVDNNAEIWIDSKKVGDGYWKGRLDYGPHSIECRKPSHRTSKLDLTVEPDTREQISLDAPDPIYGYVNVSSSPSGADVYVDGQKHGITPQRLTLLEGNHIIEVRKSGYTSETRNFSVSERSNHRFDATLSDVVSVLISSNPGGTVFVDGKHVGSSPTRQNLTMGKHKLKIVSPDKNWYNNLNKTVVVTDRSEKFSYNLKRHYFGRENALFGTCFCVCKDNFEWGGYIDIYKKGIYIGSDLSFGMKKVESYSSISWDIKIGYGVRLGSRFMFTPSVGYLYTGITNDKVEREDYAYSPPGSALIGSCKLNYAVAKSDGLLSLFIEPQYAYALSHDENTPTQMANWNNGFRLNIGIGFNLTEMLFDLKYKNF